VVHEMLEIDNSDLPDNGSIFVTMARQLPNKKLHIEKGFFDFQIQTKAENYNAKGNVFFKTIDPSV
jgi:hypothetical protein